MAIKTQLTGEALKGRNRAIEAALDIMERHSDDDTTDRVGLVLANLVRDLNQTVDPADKMKTTCHTLKAIRERVAELSAELKAIEA